MPWIDSPGVTEKRGPMMKKIPLGKAFTLLEAGTERETALRTAEPGQEGAILAAGEEMGNFLTFSLRSATMRLMERGKKAGKGDFGGEAGLKAVIGAARAILQKKTFPEAARAIFDYSREMTGAVSGYVALLNEQGDENEVLFLEAGGMPCTVDPSLPMPIRGLRAEAYRTHCAVYDNDFMNGRWADLMPGGHVELRNVLFAPLNLEGKTVGIIGLANKPGDFDDHDAETASVFGELAAIALRVSRQLDQLNERADSLETALGQVRTLHGLLPICSNCKKIRDDQGYWTMVESYISSRTGAQFTHGICPDCSRELYPKFSAEKSPKKSGG